MWPSWLASSTGHERAPLSEEEAATETAVGVAVLVPLLLGLIFLLGRHWRDDCCAGLSSSSGRARPQAAAGRSATKKPTRRRFRRLDGAEDGEHEEPPEHDEPPVHGSVELASVGKAVAGRTAPENTAPNGASDGESDGASAGGSQTGAG